MAYSQQPLDGLKASTRPGIESIGVAADIVQRHRATLAYSDRWAHTGAAQPDGSRDRAWVSLTFKATF